METAATVDVVVNLDDLDHPSARALAAQLTTIADVGVRRHTAEVAVLERRGELALYRDLLVERYGHAPTLAQIEAADELLLELTVLAVA